MLGDVDAPLHPHTGGQQSGVGNGGLNPLVANFGPAQIDRAILDALCNGGGVSFYDAVCRNLAGIDPSLLPLRLPDLAGFDMAGFLAQLTPSDTIAARHTVGLLDVIAGHPNHVNDGLPESLEEVVAAYGHSYFKLKVGGDMAADVQRLIEIAAVLDALTEPYFVSLDGNEQYNDVDAVLELWRACRPPRRCSGWSPASCSSSSRSPARTRSTKRFGLYRGSSQ